MFNVNDMVIYGTDGVCRITDITVKSFADTSAEYYVLQPVRKKGQSTVFVPVHNEKLTSKMQYILSTDEIRELINSMPDEDLLWLDDENARKLQYKEILSTGDRQSLIRLIKTLYLHQQKLQANGKKLHASDDRFFKEAEKMLYNEFAHVLNIKPDQVLEVIMTQLGADSGNFMPERGSIDVPAR